MHLSFFGIFHIEAWFIKERIPFFTSQKLLVLDGGAFNYSPFFCQYVTRASKMSHKWEKFQTFEMIYDLLYRMKNDRATPVWSR